MLQVPLNNILLLDIETVPQVASFDSLSENMQYLWDKKTQYQRKDNQSAAEFYGERAGILAEFGKIVCIAVGKFDTKQSPINVRIKAFDDKEEAILLQQFADMLQGLPKSTILLAHNGKEFDFPYLCRRLMVNGIALPSILNIAGKKPWEISHLDTMELWKFGDHKHFTSLALLSEIFGIPTSKDDIDGSQVAGVYWQQNDLPRITTYCKKDVLVLAQLLMKWTGESLLNDSQIIMV